ncbi:MAG TPA: TolC family protein [Lacunisphaera sp.]|jgi:cobalt-zinc-cadmium efflux system outer membrane protein
MKWSAIIVWSSVLCLVLAAQAQELGATTPASRVGENTPLRRLSRVQAVQEALAHNPAIIAAREQVEEAKAGVTIATAWADPALVTESDQLTSFFKPHSASERDYGLQFTVPYPNRTRLNGKVARAAWQQMQYALTQLQQQTAAQTVQAYDAILVALRHHDDLLQSQEMSRQFLEKTEARYRAGTAAKLDALKARVDFSKTTNDLIANEHMTATARAGLNRLLGRPGRSELELADALDVLEPVPDFSALRELAMNSRPELLSMTVQQEAARNSTTLAKQYWVPDLNLTLWRSHIVGAPDSYKFDGGISLPLLFWQHQKGAITQAKHHERELVATGSDLVNQVMLDVETAYSAATTAWRQAVYLRDELLPEAHAAYKAAFASYSLGGSSALELLDSKGTLLDAESQYTDALGAVNDARADLERAVGAPLPAISPGTPHEK